MENQYVEKKKKILITTGLFPPDIGGPATYSRILSEELPRQGFDVVIVAFGQVRHLPKIIRHVVYFFKVLWRARGAEVIYAQDPVSVGLASFFVAKLLQKRFLLKVVGDYAWEQGVERFGVRETLDRFLEKKHYGISVRILRFIEWGVARGADKIIVPSFYLKKVVWKWGISQSSITVIPNAFETITITDSKEELRGKLGYEGRVMLSVGRLVLWKGFEELIEVLPELQKEIPDIVLYIVGDVPERPRLEAAITRLNLGKVVKLIGRLPKSVLMNHVKAADLFVLNSSYEGFSHQLLDVMASGTPLVTTDCGGNPELIDNEKTGLVVAHGQRRFLIWSIIKLFKDRPFAERLAQEAQRKVEEFSKERMVFALITVLR